ncbi:hypothetical protein B0H12DRAFT_1237101 [Mycena haematopus]|nr:hypothetical protein B0H12DRAFT_1237101 [Mycena haematopus]
MDRTLKYKCADCPRSFTTAGGRTRHRNSQHRTFTPVSDDEEDPHLHTRITHPKLTGLPCDRHGVSLPPGSLPPPLASLGGQPAGSFAPFESREDFDFAHFHFVELQSSAAQINKALDLWAAQVLRYGVSPPCHTAQQLYDTIDSIQHGDAPWKVYQMCYTGKQILPEDRRTVTNPKSKA